MQANITACQLYIVLLEKKPESLSFAPIWIFSGCILICLVCFWGPFLWGEASFCYGDIVSEYEPFCRFVGNAFSRGTLPLWNPYLGLGISQISCSTVFYPFNILMAWFSANQVLSLFLVIHQLIACAAGYLIAKRAGLSEASGAVCGAIVGLNGYFFSSSQYFNYIIVLAWAPVCFLAFQSHGHEVKTLLRQAIFAALAVSMLLTSCRPELPAVVLTVIALYRVFVAGQLFCRQRSFRAIWLSLGFFVLAIGTGLLLTMPTLLPALELMSVSMRAAGISINEVLGWSASWYDCLCLLCPQPLGDPYDASNKFRLIMEPDPAYYPFFSSIFAGPLAFGLAVVGIARRRWNWCWCWLALFAATVLLSLGANTPVMPWLLRHVPQMGLFRYPIKLIVVAVWALAAMAAGGMQVIHERQVGRTTERVILACSVFLALVAAIACMPGAPLLLPNAGGHGHIPPAITISAQQEIGKSLAFCAISGLVFWLLIRLRQRNLPFGDRVPAAICILLSAMLLYCASWYSRSGAEPRFFARPSYAADQVLAACDKQRLDPPQIIQVYRVPLAALSNYHSPGQPFDMAAVEQYGRQMLSGDICADFGIRSPFVYSDFKNNEFVRFRAAALSQSSQYNLSASCSDLPLWKISCLTGTQFAITQQSYLQKGKAVQLPLLDPAYFRLLKEEPGLNARIYRVLATLPRAYFCSSWRWCSSFDQVLDEAANRSLDFNPLSQVLLLPHPSGNPLNRADGSGHGVVQEAKMVAYSPEHVAFEVESPSTGVAVLSDRFYTGWKATVDGQDAEIFRANGMCRAVFVQPGLHSIEFDYRPDSLAWGFKLFGAGAILCLLSYLISRRL